MKALLLAPFDAETLGRLAALGEVVHEPWLQSRRLWDPEELGARLQAEEFDVLVIEADFVTEETFALAPGLRFLGVCRGDAGPHVDLAAATAAAVPVVLTPGRNAIAVAELTVGLTIALARGIVSAHESIRAGRWQGPLDGYAGRRGIELSGRTAGLVGCGAVGREVGKRLAALGMTVVAYEPSAATRQALAAEPVTFLALDDVLRRTDFLSLHAPLTDATRGMIGERELALMRAGGYLVNTARAGLIDEEAVLRALRDGRLAGAALDVHAIEPLPPHSPWLALDNVILTPHIGGATADVVRHHSRMIADEIERWLRGERPCHLANPDVWSAQHDA
ncbi:MAG: NAD(P)-dependent oxidoreductase [Anaerolineae bacterium]